MGPMPLGYHAFIARIYGGDLREAVMNLPGNWTTGEVTSGAPKSSMKTTDNGPRKHELVNQEIKDARYWDTKAAAAIRRVSRRLAVGKARAK